MSYALAWLAWWFMMPILSLRSAYRAGMLMPGRIMLVFLTLGWGIFGPQLRQGLGSDVVATVTFALIALAFLTKSAVKRKMLGTLRSVARRRNLAVEPPIGLPWGHPNLRKSPLNPFNKTFVSQAPITTKYVVAPAVTVTRDRSSMVFHVAVDVPGFPRDLSLMAVPPRGGLRLPNEIRKLNRAMTLAWGNAASAIAVLCDPARAKLVVRHIGGQQPTGVRERGPTLIDGKLELSVEPNELALEAAIDELTNLAEQLSLGERSARQILLAHVSDSADENLRKLAFTAMLNAYPRQTDTETAVNLMLKHADPEMRLTAAAHAGDIALPVLRTLVSEGSGRHQARAMNMLRSRFDWDSFSDLAAASLDSDNVGLVAEAIWSLRKVNDPSFLETLTAFLGREEPLVVAAVTTLGGFGARAIPHLIPLLDETRVEIAGRTINALTAIGGLEAYVALQGFADNLGRRSPLLQPAALAAAQVKSALRGDHGRLSISAGSELDGQLSIAQQEGELSVSQEADSASRTIAQDHAAQESVQAESAPAEIVSEG